MFRPVVWTPVLLLLIVLTTLFAAQFLNVGKTAAYDFTSIPRFAGTLALVNLALIFLVYFCSLLTRLADTSGVPVITPLLALAFVFSLHNLNDNHSIRVFAPDPAEKPSNITYTTQEIESARPYVHKAFEAWLAARPKEYVRRFEGKPYPIYVAAAQGGGMYAANLSGLALARLYDRCPAIRHHLFAVSGVSGGSVGAGYFAALLNTPEFAPTADDCTLQPPENGKGPLETKMEELLRADFLSPVAASFLFPDLLQRFLPVPIEAFDRARAFEAGLETAWDATVQSAQNPLRKPFAQHWRPDGASPMLLLNVTVVETGQQIVISPAEFSAGKGYKTFEVESLHRIFNLPSTMDLPLSTAMSLSARFPVVMPAGRLNLQGLTTRLVDGGYFDNSGIESVMSVVQRLRAMLCKEPLNYSKCGRGDDKTALSFKAIVLTDFDRNSNPFADQRRGGEGFNGALSPVRTMFNVRVARGDYTSGRLHDVHAKNQDGVTVIVDRPDAGPDDVPVMRINMNQRLYTLPLGWQVSRQTQGIIAAQIGEPGRCGFGRDSPAYKEATEQIYYLGIGLRAVADENAKQKSVQEIYRSVAKHFLSTLHALKDNQCKIYEGLAEDGVTPQRVQCQTESFEEQIEFQLPASASIEDLNDNDRFKALISKYEPELTRKWEAKVEAALGKTWAHRKVAVATGGGCELSLQKTSTCIAKARPCDISYYEFLPAK